MDNVLVLNSDYTPINITSTIRGFILLSKGKAELLKSSDNPIISGDKTYIRPLIIRLLKYVKYRVKTMKVNHQRLFRRDNFECGYCGSLKNLTIDHILPKSRGGTNEWTNLMTCCQSCNVKKDNKTPDEAKMKLNKKPYEPTIFSAIFNPEVYRIFEDFKKEIYL